MLEFFTVDKKVCSLNLGVGDAYAPNHSLEYPAFLESLGGVIVGALPGDSVVPLGDFNTRVGNDSEPCWGVIESNSLLDLNPSSVQT